MTNTKPWREFERLITRIEKMLAPMGAEIKSPDRIPDKATGRLREVDASIRYTLGSAPVLITIECRDRKGKQDIQWLEQVKSKKDSVGANQTIVVARNGLTDGALKYAQQHGLVVRRLEEITDQFILQCANSLQIFYKRIGWKDVRCNIGFFPTKEDKGETKIKITSEADQHMKGNKPFAVDRDGEGVTIQELFQECYEGIKHRIELELNEKEEVLADMHAGFEHGNLQVETDGGKRFISTIIFSATFIQDVKHLPPLKPVSYLDENGEKVVSFSETYDPETGEGVTVQFGWDGDGKRITKN